MDKQVAGLCQDGVIGRRYQYYPYNQEGQLISLCLGELDLE